MCAHPSPKPTSPLLAEVPDISVVQPGKKETEEVDAGHVSVSDQDVPLLTKDNHENQGQNSREDGKKEARRLQDLSDGMSEHSSVRNGQVVSVSGSGAPNGHLGTGSYYSAESGPRRRICLEEVAPSHSSIIDGSPDGDWRLSLDMFTNKKRGKQEGDKKLPKRVRRYYKEQDKLISAFEEIQLDVDDAMENTEELTKHRKYAEMAAKATFFINLLLLIFKSIAAALSGSLSIFSAVIDSAVDLISGIIMWWSNRAMKQQDPYSYPQGKTKLEPIGIIVLSVIMSLASIQMIREAVERMIYYAAHKDARPICSWHTYAICISTVVIKLVLYLVIRKIRASSAQALAQDQRNDVLSNSVALAGALFGYYLWSFSDPIGAILICLYIIGSWIVTGKEQIQMLTGHTARPDFLKKITWIAVNHHHKVRFVDTVRVYHFGNNFLVEVDIVLPEDMKLRESHDIGESLQLKIEKLPEVERAFVHLDYEWDHDPYSEHKQVWKRPD